MLKKKKYTGLSLERPVPEFIPAAAMWDKQTVLTKNGELLQTIKIVGFTQESIGSEKSDLRRVVRDAISESIPDDTYAVWIHTVRRICNLDPGGNFPEEFSGTVNKSWKSLNDWEGQYVNEVFITVLTEGKKASVSDLGAFVRSLYFGSYYKMHMTHIAERLQPLYDVTDNMLRHLSGFGARRLGMQKHNEIYYSDYLRFFGKLMNLADEIVPAQTADMAQQLSSHGLAFGYNTFEAVGPTGKHFGCSFVLKEYHEMNLSTLDELLQLPMQFIITQTLDFVNSKSALEDYEEQYALLKFSEADQLLRLSGLEDIIESDNKSQTDFGEGQITMVIINDDLRGLDKDIERIQETMAELGIVAPRSDVGLEDVYWSQLPGNFSFIKHPKNLNTNKVAGLASLFNFPAGQRFENPWGRATTMFHTIEDTPYFFNFHVGENGHTAVVGMEDAGKTVLVNFLLSESRKHEPAIFMLDHACHSEVFVNALQGNYVRLDHTVTPDAQHAPPADGLLYDMFACASSHEEEALADFLSALLSFDPVEFGLAIAKKKVRASFDKPTEDELKEIPVIAELDEDLIIRTVRRVMQLPKEQRSIEAAAQCLKENTDYYRNLEPYLDGGEFSSMFHAREPLSHTRDINGYDMTPLKKIGRPSLAATYVLLYDIERHMTGRPTVIVIDEAWDLVNKKFFAARLKSWLQRIRKKNGVVIFATDNFNNTVESPVTADIAEEFATRLFLPNAKAEEYSKAYHDIWELSEEEFALLKDMEAGKREFMVKQGIDAIVCVLNLKKMFELPVLSGSEEKSAIMKALMTDHGDDTNAWVKLFCEENADSVETLSDL